MSDNYAGNRERVYEFLTAHGIPYRVEEHEAVYTVAESAGVLSDKVPVKSLLLREEKGDRTVMVIMRGDQRLDTKLLARRLGVKKFQFVKPEHVETLVGVKPGAVSLFGLLYDGATGLEVVIDETLMSESELGFHPNDNTATVFITPADAERVLAVTGHIVHQIALY